MAGGSADGFVVSTERLGWPPPRHGWRRWVPWETQTQMVYDDRPDEPSATCHLQRDEQSKALCGYPWEQLVAIPGAPSWTDLHPEMRCRKCTDAAEFTKEDPMGRAYRHQWGVAR